MSVSVSFSDTGYLDETTAYNGDNDGVNNTIPITQDNFDLFKVRAGTSPGNNGKLYKQTENITLIGTFLPPTLLIKACYYLR